VERGEKAWVAVSLSTKVLIGLGLGMLAGVFLGGSSGTYSIG
jgi:hypothetical protein